VPAPPASRRYLTVIAHDREDEPRSNFFCDS
jgi:hypothetical protein